MEGVVEGKGVKEKHAAEGILRVKGPEEGEHGFRRAVFFLCHKG